MADYGLDPSVLSYVQGGGLPPVAPAASPDPSLYGLPPQVVSGVQSGFAPQQVTTGEYGLNQAAINSIPSTPQPAPQSSAPPTTSTLGPRGRNNFGVDPSVAGAPGSPEVADTQVPSVTGGALPSTDGSVQAAPIATQPLTPDQTVATVAPLTDKQVATSNKAYDAAQAKQTAYDNSPGGLQAKAFAMKQAALDQQQQSINDASAAQQAQNDALAKAKADSLERQQKQDAIDQAKAQQDAATTDKYRQQYAQQIQDAAKFQPNTDRSIGAGGLIAIALSGIGQALDHQHGPNTALQIINDGIDKRINDEYAKKKSLGDAAADTKGLLDESRSAATDDRQRMLADKATEQTRLAQQIDQIATQYANPAEKARALAMSAALKQQAAGNIDTLAQQKVQAQNTAVEQANQRAQLGVAYGHLKLAQDEHKDQLAQQDRDFALKVEELNQAGNTKAAQALKAQQDEIQERGAMIPASLNPDGTAQYVPMMQQDGTTAWIAPKEQAKDVATVRTATIDGVKAIDILRQKRAEFGSNAQFDNWLMTNQEGRSLLQAQARALLDIHKASGINRLSGEAVDLAQKELSGGISADSIKNVSAQLDDARDMMVDSLDSTMRGANYTGKKVTFADPLKARLAPSPSDQQLEYVLKNQATGSSIGSHLQKYLADQAGGEDPTESKKQTIDNWGTTLNDPKATPAEKAKAAANLDQTIKAAQDKTLRNYALATQTQASVNASATNAAPEQTSTSSGVTAKDASYGGSAQTAAAQAQLEQAPLDALAQQANAAPVGSAERTDARQEIIRRADAGDKKARAALVQIVGAR